MQKIPTIESNPLVLGGAPRFRGTRVHFQTLIDYLHNRHGEKGLTAFLDDFPTVTREMALSALEEGDLLSLLQ